MKDQGGPGAQRLAREDEHDEEERHRRQGERIEELLGEIQASAGPNLWPRVEELVHLVVSLYGAGLARALGHAFALDAGDGALGERLAARVRTDELLSSLLLLHGLHPDSTEERVRRALEQLAPLWMQHGAEVELLSPCEDGVVSLRLAKTGCASTQEALARALQRAVEEAAPEVVRIDVHGAGAREPSGPVQLVQIETRSGRSRRQPGAGPP